MTENVLELPRVQKRITVETDTNLIHLMNRAVTEEFDNDHVAFEKAFAEAMAQQIRELSEANTGFSTDLAEELADAMIGVLLQWLGEHSCCPREDLPLFLATISRGT